MTATHEQGWLDRQRQARRGGWRVRLLRRMGGRREMLVERRKDQMSLGSALVVVALVVVITGALLVAGYMLRSSESSVPVLAIGFLALIVTGFLVNALLIEVDKTGWKEVPLDESWPSMTSTQIAAAVDGGGAGQRQVVGVEGAVRARRACPRPRCRL